MARTSPLSVFVHSLICNLSIGFIQFSFREMILGYWVISANIKTYRPNINIFCQIIIMDKASPTVSTYQI